MIEEPPQGTDAPRPRREWLEAIFDAIPAPIAVLDAMTLRLLATNRRFADLTRMAALPVGLGDAFDSASPELQSAVEAARAGGTHPALRLTVCTESGVRVLEGAIRALGPERPARDLLFAAVDVTEREQLREDLAHIVQQLTSIFGVIPDSVRVFDPDGNVVRANAQATRDAGPVLTLRDLWERERPRTLTGEVVPFEAYPTARALRGERVRSELLQVGREVAGQVVEVSANPLRDDGGALRGAVTVERDVTDRLALLRELGAKAREVNELYARVSTEAERLEKMVAERTAEMLEIQDRRARERRLAAVGRLAAGVMHDVNNAFSPIMSAAYLLDRHADNPAAVRDYAVRIAKAAETGAATAARVGRFLRQDPLDEASEAPLDLATLADEVVAMTRSLWAERASGGPIAFERRLESAPALGVAGEVRAAIINLLHNALDAMPAGGTIALTTRVENGESIVEVCDTGIGMTAEVREHAFEPFYTHKGAQGSGLGLAEVYGIMKRHRGTAELESAVGLGTTARLRFPSAPVAARETTEPDSTGPARRVLVVEDNDDGRDFLRLLLEAQGHSVLPVSTLGEALGRLDDGGEAPFDVIITDIGLPDGSGWDVVRHARSRWPSLRVGVVTGWEGGPAAAGDGADFVLRKPVRPTELLAHVARAP